MYDKTLVLEILQQISDAIKTIQIIIVDLK